jgi:hypothetical protein
MHGSGKTGPRDIICRATTLNYLKRLDSFFGGMAVVVLAAFAPVLSKVALSF